MAFGPTPPPIQAHLCVKGGTDAIAFYERAFRATCTAKHLADDGVRLMHANLSMFGGEILLHDEFPEQGGGMLSPASHGGASVAISVNLAEPSAVDRVVADARAAGAGIVIEPQDTFWGARYARVRDPFGHVWAFNAPVAPPAA